jgi:hypothetical protein
MGGRASASNLNRNVARLFGAGRPAATSFFPSTDGKGTHPQPQQTQQPVSKK